MKNKTRYFFFKYCTQSHLYSISVVDNDSWCLFYQVIVSYVFVQIFALHIYTTTIISNELLPFHHILSVHYTSSISAYFASIDVLYVCNWCQNVVITFSFIRRSVIPRFMRVENKSVVPSTPNICFLLLPHLSVAMTFQFIHFTSHPATPSRYTDGVA